MEIEYAGICFFNASPVGGLVVDWGVVFSVKPYHLVSLGAGERAFYQYLIGLHGGCAESGLPSLHFSGCGGPGIGDEILDAPHEELCAEILRAFGGQNEPDPGFF